MVRENRSIKLRFRRASIRTEDKGNCPRIHPVNFFSSSPNFVILAPGDNLKIWVGVCYALLESLGSIPYFRPDTTQGQLTHDKMNEVILAMLNNLRNCIFLA